jgi:hypothetical protein
MDLHCQTICIEVMGSKPFVCEFLQDSDAVRFLVIVHSPSPRFNVGAFVVILDVQNINSVF